MDKDIPIETLEQIKIGTFTTRDLTLATSLMTSDFPGIRLYEVTVEEPWPKDRNPQCEFHLTVEDETVLINALREYNRNRPRGLPISNSGEYDQHKRALVDAMRRARAFANQKRQQNSTGA